MRRQREWLWLVGVVILGSLLMRFVTAQTDAVDQVIYCGNYLPLKASIDRVQLGAPLSEVVLKHAKPLYYDSYSTTYRAGDTIIRVRHGGIVHEASGYTLNYGQRGQVAIGDSVDWAASVLGLDWPLGQILIRKRLEIGMIEIVINDGRVASITMRLID
ncbi:MAG: hypothetical protein FJX76_14215 [Armatimonadetes bacterium]|nr:hypothetical protein [Armatimonadota bacterium]